MMAGVFKNRKFWLVAVVAVVACGLFAGNYALSQETKRKNQDGPDVINYDTINNLHIRTSALASRIREMMAKNEVSQENLSELNFSFLEQGNVFHFDKGKQLSDALADVLHKHSGEDSYIYTLGNRVKSLGTEKTELIAIAPKFKESSCKDFHDVLEKPITIMDRSPNLASLEQSVMENEIVELPYSAGCVSTPEGIFYYQVLVKR